MPHTALRDESFTLSSIFQKLMIILSSKLTPSRLASSKTSCLCSKTLCLNHTRHGNKLSHFTIKRNLRVKYYNLFLGSIDSSQSNILLHNHHLGYLPQSLTFSWNFPFKQSSLLLILADHKNSRKNLKTLPRFLSCKHTTLLLILDPYWKAL